MELREILASIPKTISEIFDSIYCIKKDNAYLIEYDGKNLRVKNSLNISELPKYIQDNLSNDSLKIVSDNKYIYIKTIEDNKLVFISNINEDVDESHEYSLLIADDSDIITKFFTKIFKDEFNIIVAKNGEEAIKLIEENKDTNLVGAFIDLQMPVKNGYEVLEYLKENNLFSKIPVSIISGEDSQDGINKATAYDIIDMLQKPFDISSAKSIVEKTISFSSKYKV